MEESSFKQKLSPKLKLGWFQGGTLHISEGSERIWMKEGSERGWGKKWGKEGRVRKSLTPGGERIPVRRSKGKGNITGGKRIVT